MENKLVYKIEFAHDRSGYPKELPKEWTEQLYTIDRLAVGISAFLGWVGSGRGLRTSTVESITIVENEIGITTRNTVYHLKPVFKGGENNVERLY